MKTNNTDKLRVLVVEGEPVARELLGDFLKMAGYDVLSARTGEQALLTLVQERGRIDCLFTAVELPGLVDGWMLADEFRVAGGAPVVFATRTEPTEVQRFTGAAFVTYPVLPPKAVEAVKMMGKGAGAMRSRGPSSLTVTEPAASPGVELPQPVAVGSDVKVAVNF